MTISRMYKRWPSGKRIHRLTEYTSKLIKDLKIGEQKMSNKVKINKQAEDYMMTSYAIRQLIDAINAIEDLQELSTNPLLVELAKHVDKELIKAAKLLAVYVNDNYEIEG